jgi:putative transposase
MPRSHRIWFPGAMYHITVRGNNKADIFLEEKDHKKYLTLVKEAQELNPFTLHSYCLMSNHTHLLLETHNTHISDSMKYINTRYAIYFNKQHDKTGHVFQDRFKSRLIKDARYFLNASRYIHLNPLEAKIVPIQNLQDYRWSSYSSYFSSTPNPLVTTERVLSYFPEPRLDYYLQFMLSPKPEESVCQS